MAATVTPSQWHIPNLLHLQMPRSRPVMTEKVAAMVVHLIDWRLAAPDIESAAPPPYPLPPKGERLDLRRRKPFVLHGVGDAWQCERCGYWLSPGKSVCGSSFCAAPAAA